MPIRILTLPFDPSTATFDDGLLSDFLRGQQVQGSRCAALRLAHPTGTLTRPKT